MNIRFLEHCLKSLLSNIRDWRTLSAEKHQQDGDERRDTNQDQGQALHLWAQPVIGMPD